MRSSLRKTTGVAAPPRQAHVAQVLLGMSCVAAIAVLSLPQARAASDAFGWTPLWLLATPLSAWLALQMRWRWHRRGTGGPDFRQSGRASGLC